MRCLVDGRFMRRLAPGGHWWWCSNGCKELRSSDPDVEFGWQLMAGRKMVYRVRDEARLVYTRTCPEYGTQR